MCKGKGFWLALAASLLLVSACSSDDGAGSGSGSTPVNPPPQAAAHEREIRGGRIHDVMIAGLTDATGATPSRLVDAVQADLRGRLGAVQASDFAETHRNVSVINGGARLQFVTLRQTIGGVPVDDTYLHIGVRYADSGARLVSSSYHLFEDIPVDTHPAIPHDRAVLLAQQGLRLRTPVAPSAAELVVHQLDGRLQLAWSVTFPGSFWRVFVIASGNDRGRAFLIDQRIYETTGTVTGPVVRGGAPGGLGSVETDPLPNTSVASGSTQVLAHTRSMFRTVRCSPPP